MVYRWCCRRIHFFRIKLLYFTQAACFLSLTPPLHTYHILSTPHMRRHTQCIGVNFLCSGCCHSSRYSRALASHQAGFGGVRSKCGGVGGVVAGN